MPQSSIAYAIGRVRAAAKKPLGEAQFERLLSAGSYQEALQILGEMGWSDAPGKTVEQLSVSRLSQACRQMRALTTEQSLTDAFLLRHDAQNLKALFKARILGIEPELLSDCGTIPVDTLRHAVNEHLYNRLPPEFAEVMETLEKRVTQSVNPMEIDVRIDQALYGKIIKMVQGSKSAAAKKYFRNKIDLHNVLTLLRLKSMNNGHLRFSDLMLPGGNIKPRKWETYQERPEALVSDLRAYGNDVRDALQKAIQDSGKIPALEKAIDDYLLELFTPMRFEPFSIEVLIGRLLAHEREAAAVRLIMAGKLNDFPVEMIRERLREVYG